MEYQFIPENLYDISKQKTSKKKISREKSLKKVSREFRVHLNESLIFNLCFFNSQILILMCGNKSNQLFQFSQKRLLLHPVGEA